MILDSGIARVTRARVATAGLLLAAGILALLLGLVIGTELLPPLWALGGLFAALFLVWFSLVAIDTAILCLIGSVVFQNYLTLNLALWIQPVFVLAAIVLVRLFVDVRYATVAAPMDGVIRAWLLLALVSVAVAYHFLPSLPEAQGSLRYSVLRPVLQYVALLVSVLPYYALLSVLSRDRGLYEKALRLFVAVGTAVSFFALYQQAAYYLGLPQFTFLAGPGAGIPGFAFVSGASIFRSSATFLEPLDLGFFLVGTIALTMSMAIGLSRDRRWFWLALLVQTIALVVTFSGGAYAGFVAACIVFVLVFRPRVRAVISLTVLAVAIVGSASLIALFTSHGSALGVLADRPLQSLALERATTGPVTQPLYPYTRSPYRRASFELLRRYPLTGVGIGNFGAAAVTVDHNLRSDAGSYGVPWGLIGEYGLPGAVLFVYFVYRYVSAVGNAYRRHSTEAPELAGFLAGFVGMFVQSLTHGYSRLDPAVWVYVALAMAAILHSRQLDLPRVGWGLTPLEREA